MKKSAILLGFSFLLSKILGLARDNLLAATFGASSGGTGIFNLDAYYTAFRLPDLIYNLLAFGALSSAFIPLFAEIFEKKGKEEAFKFSNEIFHIVFGIVFIISVIFFFAAEPVMKLFVPGFSNVDRETAVGLTRLMLLTPMLFTIGSIAAGIHNARGRYAAIALAPILYNSGILVGIFFFAKKYGVYGPAIGVILGAALHTAVLLPGIFKDGLHLTFPRFQITNRVKEMVKLALPRIFGMSVTQISLVIDTILASTLATGSIAVLNFASNLESLPIGLIGVSVAVVSFGTLSGLAAEGKSEAFIVELKKNLRRILFLLIPISVGMFILRFQIVQLLLSRGKFSWHDTILTANTLGIFLAGLVFGGTIFLLARGFYALKNTKTPVKIGLFAVLVNLLLSILFTKIWPLGTYGLALANSTADALNAVLLAYALSAALKTAIIPLKDIGKFLLASFVMAGAVHLAKTATGYILIDVTAATLLGAAIYFWMCRRLGCQDAENLKAML